jgi:ankyrin repeat protein
MRHHNEALFASLLVATHHLHEHDQDGRNALWHMVDGEFSSFVPLSALLSRGADPNHGDRVGQTPLHLAALKGLPYDMRHLLEAGADVQKVDSVNSSILYDAVQSGNKAVITTLLTHLRSSGTVKEIVNCTDARGLSPLHLAILGRNFAIVQDTLENGAVVNTQDEKRKFPLHYLYDTSYSDISFTVKVTGWLLNHRANPYLEDEDGTPPIHFIALMKNRSMITMILEVFWRYRVNLNFPARDGSTLLHKAAALGNSALTSKLLFLSRNINVDALDETLSTPLIVWIRDRAAAVTDPMGRKDVEWTIQLLLDANAALDRRDRFGYTAIDYAVMNSQAVDSDFASTTLNIEILKILLSGTLANQDRYSSTIDFAWNLAVTRQRWRAAREIMHRIIVDMRPLRWPVGARLLAFCNRAQ